MWKGDQTEETTRYALFNGDRVTCSDGAFSAVMDSTGMVREIAANDPARRHVHDFVNVTGYIESLKR